jgi:hypothetical protein
MAIRAAVVSGFWAQNIGNAFFNLGGRYAIEQALGPDTAQFIQDQPGYWTLNFRKNPRNAFDLIGDADVEYLVIQGPVLSKIFRKLWLNTLDRCVSRGVKLVFLGAALFKYTPEEIRDVREMLQKYPPHLVSTRDQETYEAIKDIVPQCYSGIDSAFFVPKVYTPVPMCTPIIVNNFDRFPEPQLEAVESDEHSLAENEYLIAWKDRQMKVAFPKHLYQFGKGKIRCYLGSLADMRKLPNEFMGHTIIRPEHRFSPHIKVKIYKRPNSIVADEPYTYLTLYGNSTLTLSDRVHACVATLAYGNPAMLFSLSPRTRIFDRLGLSDIRKKPMSLSRDQLETERQGVLNFLKHSL